MHFGWRISEFRVGRMILAVAAGILLVGVPAMVTRSGLGDRDLLPNVKQAGPVG
jgi:hypothetical protein